MIKEHSSGSASVPGWTFERDLDDVLALGESNWPALRGARLFITGGTGFIGRWLLETLRRADQALNLGVRATILTRDPEAFARRAPHLAAHAGFDFIAGDVTGFTSPAGGFSHLIHAAADTNATLYDRDPAAMFETIIGGTRRALDLAVEKRVERFLYLSSGAVYGQQPWTLERVPEDYRGAPDCIDPRFVYGEAKRAAEMLCAVYAKQHGVVFSTARIFALLGPLIGLDAHFAAGNFIRDAMAGRACIVKSSGQPCRSYLYATDMTHWLWTMLVRAEPGSAYNVGSDESVSIRDLAERTSKVLAQGEFQVLGQPDPGWNHGRYVPDTQLAAQRLGLQRTVSLEEAIRRTATWNGWIP